MAEFSAVQAGLYAFRGRERRFVLTGATIGYLIGACLIGAAFVAAAWPALSGVVEWYARAMRAAHEGGEPPEPAMATVLAVAPWFGVYVLVALLWMSVYEAACLRWLVRGETGGVLGLALNADTLRVFLTYLLWAVLWVVFCGVVGLFYGTLIAINGAAPAFRILMMVLGALAPLGLLALLLWVATRLSPAAATSIAREEFAFFGAWSATRGRFWDMLGAFLVIMTIYIAVGFALQALVRIPVGQAMYSVVHEGVRDGDAGRLFARMGEVLSSPLIAGVLIGYVLVSMVLACVLRLAWFGVNAYVVAGGGPDEPVAAGPVPAPQTPPLAQAQAPPEEPPPQVAESVAPQSEPAAPEGSSATVAPEELPAAETTSDAVSPAPEAPSEEEPPPASPHPPGPA
ncbi:MAG: hypothetical protein R3C31_09345 [Hyphomonadaceae bacterium]